MRTDNLIHAIEAGDVEAVKSLLRSGSRPNPSKWARLARFFGSQSRAPLVLASKLGCREIVHALLEAGAYVDQRDRLNLTPLALAARYGHYEVTQLLIEFGANIHSECGGATPICFSSYYGHLPVVLLLLDKGARPSDVLGGTIGSLLRIRGSILRALVAAGGIAPPEIVEIIESDQALGDDLSGLLETGGQAGVPSVPSPVSTGESGPKKDE